MGPEHQDIREDTRESMKDLNLEIALENGAKVHEVQDGDTLWDIVKTEYSFTDDTEVANSIIKISKVNMMNDTIKKDSLSVIDGRLVNSPDGIPGDLIFAGEKIIIELQAKGVSTEIKQAELEDKDNELADIDSMIAGISIGGDRKNDYEGINPGDYEDIAETSSGEETEGTTDGSGSGGASGGVDGGSITLEDYYKNISSPSKSTIDSFKIGLGFDEKGPSTEPGEDYQEMLNNLEPTNNFEYILQVLEEREANNTRRQGRSVNIRRLTTENIQIKVENDYGQGSDYFILNPEGETIRSYQVRLGNIIVEKPKTNRTIGDLTELIKIDQVNLNNEREGRKNRQEKRKNFIKKFFPL